MEWDCSWTSITLQRGVREAVSERQAGGRRFRMGAELNHQAPDLVTRNSSEEVADRELEHRLLLLGERAEGDPPFEA